MEIQGRANVCVQLSVRIYIAVGDGTNMQKQPVTDTISFWEDCTYCSHNREDYYCTVNGELHATGSCIGRSTGTTLTSLLLIILHLHRIGITYSLGGVCIVSDFYKVINVSFFIMAM